jgi:hypothetical protein
MARVNVLIASLQSAMVSGEARHLRDSRAPTVADFSAVTQDEDDEICSDPQA